MAQMVPVCDSSATLSQGETFYFTNSFSQVCTITNCSPPLVASSYSVPAAQGAADGLCQAQVQSNASSGSYTLSCDCCALPPHNPKITLL
ncbi:MAG TPA: hypothetical protein VL523_10400 [Terriglobia bacterium]|nr:hypothetical protein [Terriglobia bacterium]